MEKRADELRSQQEKANTSEEQEQTKRGSGNHNNVLHAISLGKPSTWEVDQQANSNDYDNGMTTRKNKRKDDDDGHTET